MRSDFDDNPDELEGAVALRKVQRGWLERAEQAEAENEQLKQKRNEACDERDRARAERDHAVKWAEEEGERAGELAGQLLDTEAQRDQLQKAYDAYATRLGEVLAERDELRLEIAALKEALT